MESRNDPKSPKSEVVHEGKFSLRISYLTHVSLAQLDTHQTSKPVLVSCEFNSHWRQLYFLLLQPLEILDLCYLRKPRLHRITCNYMARNRSMLPVSITMKQSHCWICIMVGYAF